MATGLREKAVANWSQGELKFEKIVWDQKEAPQGAFFVGEFRFSTIVNNLGGNRVRNTRHSLLGLLGGMLKLVAVNGEIANSSNEMRSSLKVIKSSCLFG